MRKRATGQPATTDLASDLDRGFSLPASWYTELAIVDLERERIFLRSWQYVGRTAQVAEVGDYFTGLTGGDLPVVVVRSEEGLRAFVNVCRHRRHEVMNGAGNKKALQCPYHAWTYSLDGNLKAAPRSEREEGFDKEDLPLLPVQVDTWGPWVFVNPNLEAGPLVSILGELPRIIAQSGIEPTQLRFWQRNEWIRNANWKVMLENYLECYHCPTQHPGFSAIIDVDPDTYSLQPYEWGCSQVGPVRSAVLEGKSKKKVAYDARGAVTQSQYHFLWPNFTININPGHPNLSIDVWMPYGPGQTRGFSEQYFGANVPEGFAQEMMAFDDQVGAEDDALTDSVQRGLRAGLPEQGRFLVESEQLVIHFQRLVLLALSPFAASEPVSE
jgi:phenylpropionate dioxygenase-like ring-hydroxylating dioxygenase large terminal subunit